MKKINIKKAFLLSLFLTICFLGLGNVSASAKALSTKEAAKRIVNGIYQATGYTDGKIPKKDGIYVVPKKTHKCKKVTTTVKTKCNIDDLYEQIEKDFGGKAYGNGNHSTCYFNVFSGGLPIDEITNEKDENNVFTFTIKYRKNDLIFKLECNGKKKHIQDYMKYLFKTKVEFLNMLDAYNSYKKQQPSRKNKILFIVKKALEANYNATDSFWVSRTRKIYNTITDYCAVVNDGIKPGFVDINYKDGIMNRESFDCVAYFRIQKKSYYIDFFYDMDDDYWEKGIINNMENKLLTYSQERKRLLKIVGKKPKCDFFDDEKDTV